MWLYCRFCRTYVRPRLVSEYSEELPLAEFTLFVTYSPMIRDNHTTYIHMRLVTHSKC